MSSFKVIFKNKAQVSKGFEQFGDALPAVMEQIIDNTFIKMEQYAKDNAPWTDRTSNARGSIEAINDSTDTKLLFFLQIGVDYGIWLEIANDGKYSILQNTLSAFEHELIEDLKQVGVKLAKGNTFTIRSFA